MADNVPIPQVTERLWSEECAIADAADGMADKDPSKMPGYEWSNGRTFNSGLGQYAPPETP